MGLGLKDDDLFSAFAEGLKPEERRVWGLLREVWRDKKEHFARSSSVGLLEGFVAFVNFVGDVPFVPSRGDQRVNWPYSVAIIMSELAQRMRDRNVLKPGESYYEPDGSIVRTCEFCGRVLTTDERGIRWKCRDEKCKQQRRGGN